MFKKLHVAIPGIPRRPNRKITPEDKKAAWEAGIAAFKHGIKAPAQDRECMKILEKRTSDASLIMDIWTKAWVQAHTSQSDEELKGVWGADDPYFKK